MLRILKNALIIVCLFSMPLAMLADDADAGTQQPMNFQQQQLLKDNERLKEIVADAEKAHDARMNAKIAAAQKQLSQTSASPVVSNALSDQAFTNVAKGVMPMSTQQIRTLHQLLAQSQQAAAEDAGVPPRPTSSSVAVSLAPGATPPIVRLQAGFVTSVVFLDSTGAPWPITAYDLGDPKAFNIQWDHKGNTLMIQAMSHYTGGNLAVMLQGLDTPVMVTLQPGQHAVDYRMDLRVPGLGPNAAPDSADQLPTDTNPVLLQILDGVPPADATSYQVSGGDASAWVIGDKLYLRTRLTLVSPGWIAKMRSADGMYAYELQKTDIILASYHGQMMQLMLQGL